MGFKTPRGRQIDLSPTEAFALMGRIWQSNSSYDAYAILRLCEAIDNLPQAVGYTFGFISSIAFVGRPWIIPLALAVGSIVGATLLLGSGLVGLNLGFPLLLPLLKAWNAIPEMLRLVVPPVAIGAVLGWTEAAMWLIGLVLGSVGSLAVMTLAGRKTFRDTGLALGQAERCFLFACQVYALRSNIDFDKLMLHLAYTEDDSLALAEKCLSDYSRRFPQSGTHVA